MLTADFSPEYEPPYKGPVAQRGNGMAVASLVCGVLFCFVITAPLAVIFGIIGLLKTRDPYVGGKGMSIAGIILGVVGGGILLMFFSLIGVGFFAMNSVFSQQASVFTSHVANNEIDEAMKMTTDPVTREDVDKLAADLKTWGKVGTFQSEGVPIPTTEPGGNQAFFTIKGTAKFENATKKYVFVFVGEPAVPPGSAPRQKAGRPQGGRE